MADLSEAYLVPRGELIPKDSQMESGILFPYERVMLCKHCNKFHKVRFENGHSWESIPGAVSILN